MLCVIVKGLLNIKVFMTVRLVISFFFNMTELALKIVVVTVLSEFHATFM